MHLNNREILEIFTKSNPNYKKPELIFKQKINEFSNNQCKFDWIHAGTMSLTIAQVSKIIAHLTICPSRTGHLGNWHEIAAGRGNSLDHNGVVCKQRKIAYPLIVDLNQTECDDMKSGDIAYMPGSLIENVRINKFIIKTWNGTDFVERKRNLSYFTPFSFTDIEGQLCPITKVHKKLTKSHFDAVFVSALFVNHEFIIKKILNRLIDYVVSRNNCEIKLHDLIDRSLYLDGTIVRDNIEYHNGKFKIGKCTYQTIENLVDAIFYPFHAAHKPDNFFINITKIPNCIPFLSLSLMNTISYIINSFLLSFKSEQEAFFCHFEWGAFDSAGYPPRSKGYFREKSGLIKLLYSIITKLFPEISPIMFILLPSTIFNILPNDISVDDAYVVNDLIENVLDKTKLIKASAADVLINKIEELVNVWFDQNKTRISEYYLNKFDKKRGVYLLYNGNRIMNTIDLESFDKLSMQQACMLMGIMREKISSYINEINHHV